jgi:hypothetical protein
MVNLINLIILEVGEWRGFLSIDDKDYVRENGLEDLMHSGKDNCVTVVVLLVNVIELL